MSKCKLTLWSRPQTDGEYPIVISVGYGTRLRVFTGLSTPKDKWDATLGLPTNPRTAVLARKMLALANEVVDDLILTGEFGELTTAELKQAILGNGGAVGRTKQKRYPTLADAMTRFLATKRGSTLRIYNDTRKKLEGFCDPSRVKLDDIKRGWLEDFHASMSGLKANTRSLHLRNLRAIINFAIDEEMTTVYGFRRFRMPKPETNKRSLTIEVLRAIRDEPLPPYLDRYRDYFMLIFYLAGINIGDLCELTGLEDGRVRFRRKKTGVAVDIKVEPEAMAIIERRRGTTHLLDALDRCARYRTFYNSLISGLGQIRCILESRGVRVPALSTYHARHTWATIGDALGIPRETIGLGLGHSDGSTTGIYISASTGKLDDANRKIIDFVAGKNNEPPTEDSVEGKEKG